MRGEIALVLEMLIVPYLGAGMVYANVALPAVMLSGPGASCLARVR